MNTEEVVHVNNIFIGFAYIWISCQILRFVWNSEMVTRMKSYEVGAQSRFSFHVRFMAVAYCFSVTFLFCGLTHWAHLMQAQSETYPVIKQYVMPVSVMIHVVATIAGAATAITLTLSIQNLLEATNGLAVRGGRLSSAEATLMDVIDNCKESVAVLSLSELTFVRGNKSTSLFFGNSYESTNIIDYIHEEDQSIFMDCVTELLDDRKQETTNKLARFNDNDDVDDVNSLSKSALMMLPLQISQRFFPSSASSSKLPLVDDEEAPASGLKRSASTASLSSSASINNSSTIVIEYRVRDSKNNMIWVESTVLLHEDISMGDGSERSTVTTLMLLSRDVTDQKTERDLIRRENAAKLQYITCCAHDLKTPLQSFSSALDLLLVTDLDTEQRDICNQAEISLSLMNLTIAQTMDTSKALMGFELVPKKTTCLLSNMLTTVATIIDSYGREVPIYFTVTMDICNEIITDNEWVWQMLLNFLTNACKHTDKGSIHVNVSLCWELPAGRKRSIDISHRRKANVSRVGSPNSSFKNVFDAMRQTEPEPEPEQPPRQQLLFEIVDTGVGVEKARQDALFEVFSQAQSGQSMGTGLGLFSVYSRCDRLGGGCGLVSPNVGSDEGSTFWFTVPYVPMSKKRVKTSDFQRYQTPYILPLKEANPKGSVVVMGIDVSSWKKDMCDVNVRISQLKLPIDSSNESLLERQGSWPDSLVSSATKLMPSAFPFTAFVVDDSQSIRKLLKRTLLGMGFTRVDMFENGKRALDAMKVEMVDVVFMDIQMPIMSGPEAISRLREFEKAEQRERQCVIAVSANIENNIVGNAGFDMQHSKPIREMDIAQCMHKYMLSKGIVLEESESRRLDDDRLDTSSAFNNIIISSDSNAKV